MNIALAQVNTTVGDFGGNAEQVRAMRDQAVSAGAKLVIFPELCLSGYPPRDLLDQPHFVRRATELLEKLATESTMVPLLVGTIVPNSRPHEKPLHNALAYLSGGKIEGIYAKRLLPTYDVFDEARHFAPGQEALVITVGTLRLGLSICEDIWNDKVFWKKRAYPHDPIEELVGQKIDALINIAASPYGIGKGAFRTRMLQATAKRHKVPVLFCNLVGGNDELVFDGASMVIDAGGNIVASAAEFEEDLLLVELGAGGASKPLGTAEHKARLTKGLLSDRTRLLPVVGRTRPSGDNESLFCALSLGVHDYVHKCGFKDVVLGLSGGVDSALTAAIAVEALGAEHVLGVLLPSKFTSAASNEDALALAKNLGIETQSIPIETAVTTLKEILSPIFVGRSEDVTEENLQARIRGNILMALSNKLGHLLLSTGNKSELSVGYCTLYGDMSGGLAVISDLWKTQVYELARWVNRDRKVIPERILTKAPTAELKPNQKDSDTLPPYESLDLILKSYIEDHEDQDALIVAGHKPEVVEWVINRVVANEYKRRQMPVGIKVSKKAFGLGRRFPIARKH